MRRACLVAAAGALCLLLAACAVEESETPPADTPAPTEAPPPLACPAEVEGLASGLTLDGGGLEFAGGDPISMTFAYTNCGEEPVRLTFRDGQRYDFMVRNDDGREVWRWSADKVFTQELGEETVQPGQTIAYTEVWDQQSNAGQQVEAGRYHVLALDVGCEDEGLSRCHFGPGVFIDIEP